MAKRSTSAFLTGGSLVSLLSLVSLFSLSACDDDAKKTSTARGDSATADPKASTLDPKIEKALAAAASASPQSDNGPPPDGVFAAGAADARQAKDAPPKVEVISEGSEPRVALNVAPADAGSASSRLPNALKITVSTKMGPRTALPTIEFGLVLQAAKKDEQEVATFLVKKVAPATEQVGKLPEGLDKEIAKIAGSELRIKVPADGRAHDVSTTPAKGIGPDLERLLQGAAEGLLLAFVPLPTKPIGVGGAWISQVRAPWSGIDTVTYRSFKVKSYEAGKVTLVVDLRPYATARDAAIPGVPKTSKLAQFESLGQGEMELVVGELTARKSTIVSQLGMVFSESGTLPPQGQPAKGLLQAQVQTEWRIMRDEPAKK